MNGPTISQVDAAVRAVLAGLSEPVATAPQPIFAGRLLGLRQAEQIESSTHAIHISTGTVITPLASESLKKRGIVVRVVAASEATNTGEWGFVLEHQTGTTAAVGQSLLEGTNSWTEIGRTTLQATSWLTAGPNRGAAVMTGEGSISAWTANGVRGIRAAVASEADEVSRAIRSLGVNLLVIETDGKSIPWIRHLLATFRRAGAPTRPEGLERGSLARVEENEDRGSDRPGHAISRPPGPAERALRDRLADAAIRPGGRLFSPR
ncbi:MAG: hypothetical protein JWN86_4448 [Planctomycetota bacterium]|nr:hypothetical protein [Planctomycetota bacterium]